MHALLLLAACDDDPTKPVVADPTTVVSDEDGDGFDGLEHGGEDCDDTDPDVNPNEGDTCNGVDDDCSGAADDDPSFWESGYPDEDGDGYGPRSGEVSGCDLPQVLVQRGGDCDDGDPAVHPDALELCNGLDDDCDEETIESAERDGQSYDSIQEAVDDAAPGETVTLCDGTLGERFVVDKDLVLASKNGPEATILDGAGVGPMITVVGAEVELVGLTLRNGSTGAYGGAVNATGRLTVTDCVFEDNVAARGGAISATELVVSGSTFRRNLASAAAGYLILGGAVYVEFGSVTISTSTLSENSADYGGAIYAQGSPITVSDTTFDLNVANVSGAGIYTQTDLTLAGTTFASNRASYGGALLAEGGVHTADAATSFTDNTVTELGGAVYLVTLASPLVSWTGGSFVGNHADAAGGAVYAEVYVYTPGSSISLSDLVVDGNDATVTGGGVYLIGAPVTFTDSLLVGNAGGEGGGTSINVTNGLVTTLQRVEYRANLANHGGATDVWDATAVFDDCLFAENEATLGGGAVYVDPASTMSSVVSDWSTDAEDNLPDDVQAGAEPNATSYADYDLDETFSCSGAAQSCL